MQAFKTMIAQVKVPIFCLLDAIDECKVPTQPLFDHLMDVLDSSVNLHVALFGQPLRLTQFFDIATYKITIDSSLVKCDIDAFIKAQIYSSELLKLTKLEDMIFESIQDGSGCNFLWARLVLDDLRRSNTAGEVLTRLENLPQGLEQAYQLFLARLIKRLDPHQLALATTLLGFLVVSFRPLTVSEVQHAYASVYIHDFAFEQNLLLQPKATILEVLSGLVTITNERVQLVHFSLLKFLTRPLEIWDCDNDRFIIRFRMDLEEAHRALGSLCIDYLGLLDNGVLGPGTESFEITAMRYPFLKYATRHGLVHISRSGQASSSLVIKLKALIQSERWMYLLENLTSVED